MGPGDRQAARPSRTRLVCDTGRAGGRAAGPSRPTGAQARDGAKGGYWAVHIPAVMSRPTFPFANARLAAECSPWGRGSRAVPVHGRFRV